MPSPRNKNTQIYVSGFSRRTNEDDLEDAFKKFGKIRDVVMKNRYAFVEFSDYRDAEEAVSEMDGKSLDDYKLIVQIAGSKPTRGSKGPQADDKCYKCGKTGHWANECREEDVKRYPFFRDCLSNIYRSEKREKRCYHCGQIGHIKKYCPMIDNSDSDRSSRSRRSSRSSRSSRSPSSSRSRSPKRKHKKHHKKGRGDKSRSRSHSESKSESRHKDRKKSHKKSKKRSVSSSKSSRSRSGSKDSRKDERGRNDHKENGNGKDNNKDESD